MASDDPGLGQVFNQAIDLAVQQLIVSLPAVVSSYDKQKQQADVQPELLDSYVNREGELISKPYPKLLNVPVLQMYSQDGGLYVPLRAGSRVTCIFARHSLARWQESGGQVDPGDLRIEGLTGALCIPGLHPESDVSSNVDADNPVLFGDISLGSNTASVAIVHADRLISWLSSHTHPHGFGPTGPPMQAGTLNDVKSTKHKIDD